MLREAGAIETYELVDDEPYKFNSPLIDSPPFLLITANKGLMPLPLVAPSLLEEGEINKRVVVDKVKTISERLKEIKFKGARSNEKAIEKMLQAITQRRGQAAFRQNLLDTYKRCLVTGCEAVDALEAAHIRPYAGGGTFALSNGLLLRADIHTLFDLGLIAVDSEDMTVIILPPLEGTEYELYDGETLKFSEGTAGIPDVEALDEHLGTAVLNWKN
ncbi:MAG: HNH endonuclease [Anaerolineae bacterium]|nr:HNH endonuclease [Anaerolineae bacterium]